MQCYNVYLHTLVCSVTVYTCFGPRAKLPKLHVICITQSQEDNANQANESYTWKQIHCLKLDTVYLQFVSKGKKISLSNRQQSYQLFIILISDIDKWTTEHTFLYKPMAYPNNYLQLHLIIIKKIIYFFPLEKGITRIMMQRKMLLKKDCVHSLESKQDACLLLEEELMLV